MYYHFQPDTAKRYKIDNISYRVRGILSICQDITSEIYFETEVYYKVYKGFKINKEEGHFFQGFKYLGKISDHYVTTWFLFFGDKNGEIAVFSTIKVKDRFLLGIENMDYVEKINN